MTFPWRAIPSTKVCTSQWVAFQQVQLITPWHIQITWMCLNNNSMSTSNIAIESWIKCHPLKGLETKVCIIITTRTRHKLKLKEECNKFKMKWSSNANTCRPTAVKADRAKWGTETWKVLTTTNLKWTTTITVTSVAILISHTSPPTNHLRTRWSCTTHPPSLISDITQRQVSKTISRCLIISRKYKCS